MGEVAAAAKQRWIIHADLDAFFASVEQLLDPSLAGKAIIVGGSPQARGVVASASYPARRYGVRSAMPVARALRLCPHAILVPARHSVYGEHSQRVMNILQEITPLVEQVSIDEAFLDVTGCEALWGPVEQIAQIIRRRINSECGLPVSLGVATNKLVAKIACDLGKPEGLIIVSPGDEQAFLAPLPIEKLWGVGQVTGARLRDLGVQTIGQLATWPEEQLVQQFGEGGHGLYHGARGIDSGSAHISHEQRSISKEVTFARDVSDTAVLQRTLLQMSDSLATRLRHEHLVAKTVRLKLRYPDFSTITRQQHLKTPTDQADTVYGLAIDLLHQNLPSGQRLRLLGLAVSDLIEEGGYQLSLLDSSDQKQIKLSRTVDLIRERYGRGAISRASLLRRSRHEDDEAP
jgi:DNA polymerase-4